MNKIPEDLFPKEERIFLSSVCDKMINADNLKKLLSAVSGFGFVSKITDAERKVPAVNFDFSPVPTDIILMEGISGADVSHRDVLGSLMSLGIKRQKIGDILTD